MTEGGNYKAIVNRFQRDAPLINGPVYEGWFEGPTLRHSNPPRDAPRCSICSFDLEPLDKSCLVCNQVCNIDAQDLELVTTTSDMDTKHLAEKSPHRNRIAEPRSATPVKTNTALSTAPTKSDEWKCSACTFLNKPMHLACAICRTQKPDV